MAIITDGKTGYTAGVTHENMIKVKALNTTHISHHSHESHHQNAFIVYGKHNVTQADTDELAFHFEYTGTEWLVVDSIIISTDAATTDVLTLEFFKDTEHGNDGRAIEPLNTNFASSNKLSGHFHDTNAGTQPMTLVTPGTEFMDLKLNTNGSPFVLSFREAIYMPANTSIGIIARAGNIGTKVRFNMLVFEDEKE